MDPKYLPNDIPDIHRVRIVKPSGKPTWHGVTPTRFACTLPPVKGPVRAREDRGTMKPDLPAQDPFGTPQLPSEFNPPGDLPYKKKG